MGNKVSVVRKIGFEDIQYIEQNYGDYLSGQFPTLDIAIMQTVHEITRPREGE